MSVVTVVAFYVEAIHLLYYLSIPVIYAYIVFKVINFAPTKIDAVRAKNMSMVAPAAKKPVASIDEKVGPKIEKWIDGKGFCTPDLTIKTVASEIGTNQNYLSQYLNNNLGVTFQVWLNTLRIKESLVLLKNGDKKSIEEIGIMVGIPQSYNFSRWFRIVTGTTPFQYRKTN